MPAILPAVKNKPHRVEDTIQHVLWFSRFVVPVPVLMSVLVAIALFYIASADVFYVLTHLGTYTGGDAATAAALRTKLVGKIIKTVDVYLLAAFLFIFAFGLYELFISKLRAADESENAPRLLVINSLDDLKARLAQVALLVLIVEFLQVALDLEISRPLDLLYLAAGIALISGAVFLSSKAKHGSDH